MINVKKNVISAQLKTSLCLPKRWAEEDRAVFRIPTQTGKPGKIGRHFRVFEKSGNFEQTGKVRKNHTKY